MEHSLSEFGGVLLIDKPSGWTSFDVVKKIKKLVRPLKVGHTGTLDPMATGLLPLLVGEATKLNSLLTASRKRYRARVQLGTATDTLDSDGAPTESKPVPKLDRDQLLSCLERFTGRLEQIPPMYSAIHHQGKRLHELARAGLEVVRKPRVITIESLVLDQMDQDGFTLDVTCSAGTYVRSLAADVAVALGTVGHLTRLERLEVGDWTLSQAIPVQALTAKAIREALLPLGQVLTMFDQVAVSSEMGKRLANGQRLSEEELNQLEIEPPADERMVCFMPPTGKPVILAWLAARGTKPPMKIWRVLAPDPGKSH